MALLAILQVAWLGWFLLAPLPNVNNVGASGLCRYDLLIRSVPQIIPGLKFSESYLGLALKELGHVENLPQRLPILLAATYIALAATALGGLILRALRFGARVGRGERLALAYALGATGSGMVALIAGRLGLLNPSTARIGLALPIAVEAALLIRGHRPGEGREGVPAGWTARGWLGFGLVVGPFLVIMFLGAMLPTVDFDAIEYHLQGPKEYFQNGRIAFLPHNVYTSMPFGIEMLHLLGMEVVDDWWRGALVGQVLVALFAPASAALIAGAATRLGSPRAGWVAAVVYLTTPWIYRLGVLPYVEGPLCCYHAALIWAVVLLETGGGDRPSIRSGLLVGLLAGGAMAIKYPALISAVIPFAAWSTHRSWRDGDVRVAIGFALGVALVMAPWLAKNVVDTGNPVYPLAYKVFGGRQWDAARDAKWSAAHGPKAVALPALLGSIVDVAGRSDWQSPLFAALAPLAWLRAGPNARRSAGWLGLFAAYIFGTWWLFTHRLDRFWLPILPPLAILAGLGAYWVRSVSWSILLGMILTLAIAINAVYCSTALAGLNQWTGDLTRMRTDIPELLNPPLARLDATLPPGAKPLLVGQAAVFHLNRPVVYNTVFNLETIETLARDRSPAQVRGDLARLGVTHVYVDWFEVERYRSPGNYGFTPYVQPEVFARLVEAGVLGKPQRLGMKQELFEVRPVPLSRPPGSG